jgi:hypothetical protein
MIGLLLAVIDLPDFMSPMRRIAAAIEKHAGIEPPPAADPKQHDSAETGH